jgi:hypothetical protein
LAAITIIFLEYHSATFLEKFLPQLLQSHFIYSADVRFPHRGEMALIRKNLVSCEQPEYEIRPIVM